jgi:hypothetical protein
MDKEDEMKVGTKVTKPTVPGSSGTITKVNTQRRPSITGKVFDCWVAWDQRNGAEFGAKFDEIRAV